MCKVIHSTVNVYKNSPGVHNSYPFLYVLAYTIFFLTRFTLKDFTFHSYRDSLIFLCLFRIYGSQNECYARNGVVSEYYSYSGWLTAECESTSNTDDYYNYDDNGYTWGYQIIKCQGGN